MARPRKDATLENAPQTPPKGKGKGKDKEEVVITTNSIVDKFLKENKAFHYNFEEDNFYQVSTGSFKMDVITGGGFSPGLQRFLGPSESGKSSAALEVMKNFLADNGKKVNGKVRKRRAVYFKAEGRLSPKMRARSGVEFVFDVEEWKDGNCFVFESNIYETVCEFMKMLVFNNPEGIEYFFVVDSVDGLSLKNDIDKPLTEAAKVAGGAVVASLFMKRMSIPLAKRGHIAIFLSQVRASISIDTYSSAPIRQITGTGGNALHHYANWIWEFGLRFGKEMILKDDEAKPDPDKNPILGHWVPVTIKKSDNETSNMTYRYPVKYGRTDGRSVWVEKELVDLMMTWDLVEKKGSWFKLEDQFVLEIEEEGIDLESFKNKDGFVQFQGTDKLFAFIENQDDFRLFAIQYFKEFIDGISNKKEHQEEETAESGDLPSEVGGEVSFEIPEEG